MSLLATLAQNYRVKSPGFDKNEFRMTNMGITNAYMNQSKAVDSILSPELIDRAMMSSGRNVQIPVINYQDITVRTTRPITIPTFSNNSALVTVTWVTMAFGFPMRTAEHFNNEIDWQTDFNKKYEAMLVKFASTLEGYGATNLNNGKTLLINGVSSGTTVGGHTLASGVVSETVTLLKDSEIMADIPSMMLQNDFKNNGLDIIGNPGFKSIMQRQEGFGEFNTENKRVQWANNNYQWSNAITDASGKNATFYAVPSGNLGILFRVEPDALLRTDLGNGTKWDTIVLPGLDIPCGTYEYPGTVDISGEGAHVAHLSRTGQFMLDFAFEVGFLTAYNSNTATRASGIIKADVEKS